MLYATYAVEGNEDCAIGLFDSPSGAKQACEADAVTELAWTDTSAKDRSPVRAIARWPTDALGRNRKDQWHNPRCPQRHRWHTTCVMSP
jgi:hypothetical protein